MATWIPNPALWRRLLKAAHRKLGSAWNLPVMSPAGRKTALLLALAAAGVSTPVVTALSLASTGHSQSRSERAAESAAALQALLTQRDVNGRRSTVLEIGATGAMAVKAADLLLEPLRDSDAEVRACTAMVLLNLGVHGEAATKVLVDLLQCDQLELRCLAAFILGETSTTDSEALQQLAALLECDQPAVCLHAAEALVKISGEHPRALAVLGRALDSTDSGERSFVVHALASLDRAPSASLKFRIATLQGDSDREIAASAAVTLIRWTEGAGEQSSRPQFVSRERREQISKLLEDQQPAVRRAAAVRLMSPTGPLTEAARASLKDHDAVVQASAAHALAGSPDDGVMIETTLLELLESDDDARAIPALGTVGRMTSVPQPVADGVERHLDSPNAGTRLLAATVLARIAPERESALQVLTATIEQGTPDLRALAARSVKLTSARQDAGVRHALGRTAREENLRIRSAAARALISVGSQREVRTPGTATSTKTASDSDDDSDGDAAVSFAAQLETKTIRHAARRLVTQVSLVDQPAPAKPAEPRPPRALEPLPSFTEALAALPDRAPRSSTRPAGSTTPPGQRPTQEQHSDSASGGEPTPVTEEPGKNSPVEPISQNAATEPPPEASPAGPPRTAEPPVETPEETPVIAATEPAPARVTSAHGTSVDSAAAVTVGLDEGSVPPEFRSIRSVSAGITITQGDLPLDPGRETARLLPRHFHQLGVSRGFGEVACPWTAPAVKHYPLYFQEIALERYGYHYGAAQSFISSAVFLRNVTLLPIRVLAEPPCSRQYTLGYERPGNFAPVECYRPQLLPMPRGDYDDEPEDEVIPAYKVCR